MGMTRYAARFILCLASMCHMHSFGASPVTMERESWPQPHDCVSCVSLQFGILSMQLPSTLVGKIFISASSIAQLHIIPTGGDIKTSLFFHSLPSAQMAGKYRSLVRLPLDPQLFFDRLGVPASRSDPWSKIRTVEQLDTARRYTKTSKGTTHVYWIQGSLANSHRLYFVIEGTPLVYAVAGELTPEFVDAMLSHLVVTAEP